MITAVAMVTSLEATSNKKYVFFSGFYAGVPLLSQEFDPLKKEFYNSIFPEYTATDGSISKEAINTISKNSVYFFHELNSKKIGQHTLLSISDSENLKKNLKSIVISYISLDDIIVFHETTKYKNSYSTRLNIYNLFSFYAVELKSMRIIYSKQYILPMSIGIKGKYSDLAVRELFSSKKNMFKDAAKEVLTKSIADKKFSRVLDLASENSNFMKAKNFMVIKNKLSIKSKKRITKNQEFNLFTSYALSSALANELPLVSPILAYAMDENGKYKDNNPFLMQIKSNIDMSLDVLSYKLNMNIDRQAKYKALKVSGKKLKLPLLTFPNISIVLNDTSFLIEKDIEKNSIRIKKLFAVKHRFAANVLKKNRMGEKIQKSISNADIKVGKKKIRFSVKGAVIENIPNSTLKQSDLYFFNASLNASLSKKSKIGDHYNLDCLIRNKCSKN